MALHAQSPVSVLRGLACSVASVLVPTLGVASDDGVITLPEQVQTISDPHRCGQANCPDSLPVITVTAQRIAAPELRVPMSISAYSGDEIEQRDTDSLLDIAAFTPGLNVYEEGPGRSSLSLRGIASTVGSSTVSVNLNDIVPAAWECAQLPAPPARADAALPDRRGTLPGVYGADGKSG